MCREHAISAVAVATRLAALLPLADSMSPDLRTPASGRCTVLIGRTVAACVHPMAAWHSTVHSFRLLLLAGYFTVGYFMALTVMVFMN